jgi:hypothetical protein
MAITNTSIKQLGDYTFNEIGSFSVEQLAGVSFNRQFTPVTNTSKVSIGETWGSITTSWASETRTWLDCSALIDNTSFKSLGSYTAGEVASFTVEQLANVSFDRQFSPIINSSKPI